MAKALADHPAERFVSLLAIAVSHLEERADVQLELPLGLADAQHRPGTGTPQGIARGLADAAVDRIRGRFGWGAVGYAAAGLAPPRSVPDAFRELAEREL